MAIPVTPNSSAADEPTATAAVANIFLVDMAPPEARRCLAVSGGHGRRQRDACGDEAGCRGCRRRRSRGSRCRGSCRAGRVPAAEVRAVQLRSWWVAAAAGAVAAGAVRPGRDIPLGEQLRQPAQSDGGAGMRQVSGEARSPERPPSRQRERPPGRQLEPRRPEARAPRAGSVTRWRPAAVWPEQRPGRGCRTLPSEALHQQPVRRTHG